MAQVYSLNVVGYCNVTANGGLFTFMGNPLSSGTNTLQEVMPAATTPAGTIVLTWNISTYQFHQDITDGSAWFDGETGTPTGSTTTLEPGKGFFVNNPGSTFNVTFVGEVKQGTLTVPIKSGFNAISSMTPQALELSAANGFPQVAGMLIHDYQSATAQYVNYINDGTQWINADTGTPTPLTPGIGAGYFAENSDATTYNWTRNFTVQ